MRKEDKGGGIMERLTIDEVIEHCNKTCDMTEKIANVRGHKLESIESKQFWEHYQVRNWLNELKQYKDLEEQGLLLRLPCKVGDIVYSIAYNGKIYPVKATREVRIVDGVLHIICESWRYSDLVSCNDIGKTVFLT